MTQSQPITPLNHLLVNIDRSYGARALGYDFLDALKASLEVYQHADDHGKIKKVLNELTVDVYNCRPRIALILRYSRLICKFVSENKTSTGPDVIEYIDSLIQETQQVSDELVKNSLKLIRKNSSILIHTHSNTVNRILEYCVDQKKTPKIIVAAQEEKKTFDLIRKIKKLGLEFSVVPEYVLAHIADDISFALFGALTYNCHDECVMSPGSAAIIAELHHLEIPCYIAMATDKFSLWKDLKKHHTLKRVNMRAMKKEKFEYEKLTFSHDRVPLNWIDGLITEKGICSAKKVRSMFKKRMECKMVDE